MAAITAPVTAITEMFRWRVEAVPINAMVVHPTLNSVWNLVDQLVAFPVHFATTKWGGKHGFFPLVLTEIKMRLAAGIQDLEYGCIKQPELLNPKIEDDTKGREVLQIQEDHKVKK